MNKIAVLAGNKEQFNQFLRENNLTEEECQYVRSEEDIMGRKFTNIIKYGTYWQNPAYHLLEEKLIYNFAPTQ